MKRFILLLLCLLLTLVLIGCGKAKEATDADAADNTIRRALHFSQAGKTICLTLPLTKEELGSGLGRTSCAMVAVTDVGFAASIAERLAQDNQETYGEAWQTLAQKAARVKQRRDAKRSPNKNKGKRRKA